MFDKHWKHDFDELIEYPLAYTIGCRLHRVSFAVLDSDYAGFDVDNPNSSGGCQAVILHFKESLLVLEWASKPIFTQGIGEIMFHIMPYYILSGARNTWTINGNWKELSADFGTFWKKYVGHDVSQVSVFTDGKSPQAVRFAFSSGDVALAVGSTYKYPVLEIGDGNEILHLNSDQLPNRWQELRLIKK